MLPGYLPKSIPPNPPPHQPPAASMLKCFLVDSAQVNFRLSHGSHEGQHSLLSFPRDRWGSSKRALPVLFPRLARGRRRSAALVRAPAERPGRSKGPHSRVPDPTEDGRSPFPDPAPCLGGRVGSGPGCLAEAGVLVCGEGMATPGAPGRSRCLSPKRTEKGSHDLPACPRQPLSTSGEATSLPSPGEGESARRGVQTWEPPCLPQSCVASRLTPLSSQPPFVLPRGLELSAPYSTAAGGAGVRRTVIERAAG